MAIKLLTIIPLYIISYILYTQKFIKQIKTIEIDAMAGIYYENPTDIYIYEYYDNRLLGMIIFIIALVLTYKFFKKGD